MMCDEKSGSVLPHARRKFYDLPEGPEKEESEVRDSGQTLHAEQSEPHEEHVKPKRPRFENNRVNNNPQKLFSYIEDSVIGKDKVFSGPFGLTKAVYCDYTASGRSLNFLEKYIENEVLPEYGNTHTTTTVTSLQTTLFRHEARDIIRNAVHASEHDAVIFAGSGCTGAVHKLIHALHLTQPPVVFVGPFEHHSNLLPWREVGAHVIRIAETPSGLTDTNHLIQKLKEWQGKGRQLIGCFSVASNITGILTDVNSVTVTLHRHGALALWDYATAGPYLNIDMNPVVASEDQSFVYKDAVFVSPHKFVGGVQTPGLLIAKKKLFKNPVPSDCGGGSVFFVRRDGHRYLQEAEMREEGGTPAIVESVRAGLVFQLKEAVTCDAIMDRERQLLRHAVSRWRDVESLVMLGNLEVDRLPIFSFLVRHPHSSLYLHHNFVCAVLNDLFGIQARGGCACAGPYAEDLLGIDEALAVRIEELLAEDSRLDRVHLRRYREYSDREIIRPGFVRLNLPYFLSDETIDFILEAVKMVAEHGWQLLPQYTFNPETGEWRHRSHQVFRDRKWLGYISYKNGEMKYKDPPCPQKGPLPSSYQELLDRGKVVFEQCKKARVHIADQTVLFDEKSRDLRWFLLPSEALLWLQDPKQADMKNTHKSPFEPVKYPKSGSCVERSDRDYLPIREQGQILPGRTLPSQPIISEEFSTSLGFKAGLTQELSSGFTSENGQNLVTKERDDKSEMSKCDTKSTQKEEDCPAQEMEVDSDEKPKDSLQHAEDEVIHKQQDTKHGDDPRKEDSRRNEDCDNLTKDKDKIIDGDSSESTESKNQKKSVICADGACFMPRTNKNKPEEIKAKTGKHTWHCPPKHIFKPTVQALDEYKMIQNGDKVLVCLSGGKDSLSLLHTIRQYSFYAKKKGIKFELGAVTVDPMTNSYDPSPLKGYLAQLGIPYFYEEQAILEQAAQLPYEVASICSFCSRMKRGRIYHAARREGYNVLALGQHLDDLSESFLMSMFHNGILRTMKASYTVKEGDLRVIRPFVYVREKDLRQFAEEKRLPIIPENCPACFEAPKERHRMKQLLAGQEVMFPRLFHSLQAAIKPVMAINKTGVNASMIFAQAAQEHDDEEDEF